MTSTRFADAAVRTTRSPLVGAASTLLTPLLAGPELPLREAARTRSAVHYATGRADVPVLCVSTPDAVRLPNAFVSTWLPVEPELDAGRWQVTRWWRPDRPAGLWPPAPDTVRGLSTGLLACLPALLDLPQALLDLPQAPGESGVHALRPAQLVGRGEGLTPAGDDVLAAALVTARATDDPRLPRWRAETFDALRTRRTTAVSLGLLRHALDGYAVPELAHLLLTLCVGGDLDAARRRLVALGHSSGGALLRGVVFTLTTRPTRSDQA